MVYDYNFYTITNNGLFSIGSIMTALTSGSRARLAPLICGVYGVDDGVLVNGLSEYGVHQVLQVAGLALLLDPTEDAARELGEVVHADLLVEGLEQGVHEDLENLKPFGDQS